MGKQALDGKRLQSFFQDPNQLVLITEKTHPLYDERVNNPPTEEMVASLISEGVQQPIGVYKDGDEVKVIFGRQRVINAREANRRGHNVQVPCRVFRGSMEELVIVSLTENEIRVDDDPVTKARKVRRALSHGASEADVARAMGVSGETIRQWGKLLECDSTVQKAVEKREYSMSAALKHHKKSHEDQRKELASAPKAKPDRKGVARPTRRKKAETKPKAPSPELLRKIAARVTRQFRDVLLYAAGDLAFEDVGKVIPCWPTHEDVQ
jgi:ParB family chromosome partitioning protein